MIWGMQYIHLTIATRQVMRMSSGLQWARSMGMATMSNKRTLLAMLMGRAEQFEEHLREIFADFDLSVILTSCSDAYTCRCWDLAILVLITDRRQTKQAALPLAHVCGVISIGEHKAESRMNMFGHEPRVCKKEAWQHFLALNLVLFRIYISSCTVLV